MGLTHTVFVVFQIPAFNFPGEAGPGIGPGFGYWGVAEESKVFVSGDGIAWDPCLVELAFEGLMVPREPGMVTLYGRERNLPGEDELPNPGGERLVFKFFDPYPNPFNPKTVLKFVIPSSGPVNLAIFNLRGQRVRNLVSRNLGAGSHEIVWRGINDSGGPVASGVYFARLKCAEKTAISRLTLVR